MNCSSSVRVRYAETDQMGVAWHGGYFAWFEVGRTDLLRAQGLSYRDLEARDIHLPVIEAHARFIRPARYDDVLEIHTRLANVTGVRLRFEYEVKCAEGSLRGELLATGTTMHAAIDSSGRPRRLPESLRDLMPPLP